MLIMKTTKRLKDIRIVLSIRHWDYGEKVISGLMEGEARDDRKRGGERRTFFIGLREM